MADLRDLAGEFLNLIHPLLHGGRIAPWHTLPADFVGEIADGVQARLQRDGSLLAFSCEL